MPDNTGFGSALGSFLAAYIFGRPLIYLAFGLSLLLLECVLRVLTRGFAWFWRFRSLPLQEKHMWRATGGAFALVGCIVVAAHGFPVVGPKLTAGVALFALLYLVVGITGTLLAESLTFDPMAVCWRCAVVIGGAALLVYAKTGGL
jgi:hypothetical protein